MHKIRLRGAWRIERREDGSAVFERSFGSPRTLDDRETVWLVCDAVPGNGAVWVNGSKMGDAVAGSAFESDVTGVMVVRNTVRFELDGVCDADLGGVGLEFRSGT